MVKENFSVQITEALLKELRNGIMESFTENGDSIRGAAVLEKGYIDLELNISSAEQVAKNDVPPKTPILAYFCCVKCGNSSDDWTSDDYINNDVEVDWTSDDWKQQLKNDMEKKLEEYRVEKGYHYDMPNIPTWHKYVRKREV